MNPVRWSTRMLTIAALLIAAALLVAGCSSTQSSSGSTTTGRYGASGTTATVLGASTVKKPASTGTVRVRPTRLGRVLTDSAGHTLYIYEPDATGSPTCTGPCAQAWPPYLAKGTVTGGTTVVALLSTVAAAGDKRQVTVDGRPVYRFSGDLAPGQATGQSSGGVWFVLDPSGTVIKS